MHVLVIIISLFVWHMAAYTEREMRHDEGDHWRRERKRKKMAEKAHRFSALPLCSTERSAPEKKGAGKTCVVTEKEREHTVKP